MHRLLHIEQQHGGKILDGKVAVITGAGQGIGAATAKIFASNGAMVVLTDLDAQRAECVAHDCTSLGALVHVFNGNLMEEEFPSKLIGAAIQRFGAIHYLVNNAGFTWDAMLHKMTDKQWEAMLNIHVTAPFRLIRAAAPHMRDAGKNSIGSGQRPDDRCIINISSISGTHGNVGQANYSAAKAAVVGLTKTIAKEWGPFGVRCNTVAFGAIHTRLIQPKDGGASIQVDGESVALGLPKGSALSSVDTVPLGRVGTPEEAAGAILLLCSPYATYITGQCLEVTGGAFL